MGYAYCNGAHGIFPVAGTRTDRGAPEPFMGFGTWGVTHWPDSGDECMVFSSVLPKERPVPAFRQTGISVDREFVKRLGAYDRTAHAELVEMHDWQESKGFDVQAVTVPDIRSIFGDFPFTAWLSRDGDIREVRARASWKADGLGWNPDMRHIRVSLGTGDEDPVGEIGVECDFIGELAADAPNARERLIERMGWDTEELGVSLH